MQRFSSSYIIHRLSPPLLTSLQYLHTIDSRPLWHLREAKAVLQHPPNHKLPLHPWNLRDPPPPRKRTKHLRNSCVSSTDSDHAPTVTAATCPVDATPQADFMDTGVISDASGVISDAEENALSPEPGLPSLSVPLPSLSPTSNPASRTSTTLTPTAPTSARLDMSSFSPLPPTTRKLYVTSADPDKKLTQMNPCLLQQEVDLLLGPIHTIEYLRSGSLLLTTKTSNQVSLLLDATHLPTSKIQIPITSTVAWNQQFTYGKLYAREFSFDSLETTLEYLRPHNVVAVRHSPSPTLFFRILPSLCPYILRFNPS